MSVSCKMISVVTPFYKGNRYINELISNVNEVAAQLLQETDTKMELIVVNDSPDVPVEISVDSQIPVTVLENPQNLGIHGSRINGIRHAQGDWIQMLDQDDLLIPEQYLHSVRLCDQADVVVGNCYYYHGDNKQLLYRSEAAMNYLIRQDRFLSIRNLIASPGHCLVKKAALPAFWMENPMMVNGADDYYLWVLMFHQQYKFANNPAPVYIHRNSEEGNLSFDLAKMYRSCEEMCQLLEACPEFPANKLSKLRRSVLFKYLYDTHQLSAEDWLNYADKVFDNVIYKIVTCITGRITSR